MYRRGYCSQHLLLLEEVFHDSNVIPRLCWVINNNIICFDR